MSPPAQAGRPRRSCSALLAAFCLLAPGGASAQAGSETQASVVALALRGSPQIDAARHSVAAAIAKVGEMNGHRRFGLTLSGLLGGSSGRVAEPASNQSFWSAEADLVAAIPNAGRADAEIDQASAELLAARARLDSVVSDVEFRAESAYLEYWRAKDALAIALATLAQATGQADDTRKRIDAGDVPQADLLKAQVQVAQAEAARARAQASSLAATAELNDLLLRSLDAPVNLAAPAAPEMTPGEPPKLLAAAQLRSPAIREAQATLDGSKAALRVAKHARDTDLSLQLGSARTSDPTAYSELTTLSLNFSLPISGGGAFRQQVRQAQALVDQDEATLRATVREVALQVQQALLEVEGDQANLTATAQTETIARESLAKARQAFDAGLTTTRDVLDAQLVYSQSRVEANAARYDLAIAQARVKQLVGDPSA